MSKTGNLEEQNLYVKWDGGKGSVSVQAFSTVLAIRLKRDDPGSTIEPTFDNFVKYYNQEPHLKLKYKNSSCWGIGWDYGTKEAMKALVAKDTAATSAVATLVVKEVAPEKRAKKAVHQVKKPHKVYSTDNDDPSWQMERAEMYRDKSPVFSPPNKIPALVVSSLKKDPLAKKATPENSTSAATSAVSRSLFDDIITVSSPLYDPNYDNTDLNHSTGLSLGFETGFNDYHQTENDSYIFQEEPAVAVNAFATTRTNILLEKILNENRHFHTTVIRKLDSLTGAVLENSTRIHLDPQFQELRQTVGQCERAVSSAARRVQINHSPLITVDEVIQTGLWRKKNTAEAKMRALMVELASRALLGDAVLIRRNINQSTEGNAKIDDATMLLLKNHVMSQAPVQGTPFEEMWDKCLRSLQNYCSDLRRRKVVAATTQQLQNESTDY